MAPASQPNLFCRLSGSPSEYGRSLGELWRAPLAQRLEGVFRAAATAGIPRAELADRAGRFADLLERTSPGWLAEVEGAATGAGVEPEDLYLLNALPDRLQEPGPGECSGFASVSEARVLLFKIRDLRNLRQAFHLRLTDDGRAHGLAQTIGHLGAGHLFRSDGFAGACHTGSYSHLSSDGPLLNDCHVLRFIGEHADGIGDVGPLYDSLAARGATDGSGSGRGAIYLFADPTGAVLLEAAGNRRVLTPVGTGIRSLTNHFLTPEAAGWCSIPPELNTTRRLERIDRLLDAGGGADVCPEAVFALSRDRKHHPHSLCNDDRKHAWMTVSAQLHVLDRTRPSRSVTHVCCGNTRQSVYVPVPHDARDSFVPWADGTFWSAANRLYRRHGCTPPAALTRHRSTWEGTAPEHWQGAATAAYRCLLDCGRGL